MLESSHLADRLLASTPLSGLITAWQQSRSLVTDTFALIAAAVSGRDLKQQPTILASMSSKMTDATLIRCCGQ